MNQTLLFFIIAIAIVAVGILCHIYRDKEETGPQYDFMGGPLNDAAWEEQAKEGASEAERQKKLARALRIKKIREKNSKADA